MKYPLIILFIVLLVSACHDEEVTPMPQIVFNQDSSKTDTADTIPGDSLPVIVPADSISFTLYINYSTQTDTCNIFRISVDDLERYHDTICFKGITPCFVTIRFSLKCSTHTLKAESAAGSVSQLISFDLTPAKTYGILDYKENMLTFSLSLNSSPGID